MERPSLQHIRHSAAARLDFVEFIAAETVVSVDFAVQLARIAAFSAAVCGYRSLLPLGYCGLFCWSTVHHFVKPIAEEPLLDYLRVAAYCSELPAADKRHIALDTAAAKRRFPALFRFHVVSSGQSGDAFADIGSFAPRHEFRAARFPAIKQRDEAEYAAYLEGPA